MRESFLKFLILSGLVAFSGATLSGCGGLRRSIARRAGIKVKTKTVRTRDLGSSYKKLEKTPWDFFGKRAKRKRIKITYQTFGMKSVDRFNRGSAEIFAQYRFADAVIDKTYADLRTYLKVDARKINRKELNRAINRNDKEQIKLVRKIKDLKKNVTLSIRSLGGLVGKATGMQAKGNALISKTPTEMMRDPLRAIYADKAVSQLTKSVGRLAKVAKGTPKLLKKLKRLKDVLGWII